jgi:hypothetical protein
VAVYDEPVRFDIVVADDHTCVVGTVRRSALSHFRCAAQRAGVVEAVRRLTAP